MFEDVLDKYKDDLTEALVASGEAHRVHKTMVDVELKRPDYLYFYEEGIKSGQGSVNNAQEKLNKVLAIVKKYIDDVSCSHPMSQFELGVLEVASEIDEVLKYDF